MIESTLVPCWTVTVKKTFSTSCRGLKRYGKDVQAKSGIESYLDALLSCLWMRRELSSLEYSVSHSTQTAPYTHTRRNRLLFAKRQRGSLNCMRGVQTHSRPPVFLVQFRKDQARMNGTPQPNQKWLPALGIEPGSLDHKPQPLTIGPFLTLKTLTSMTKQFMDTNV